jgi:5-oxoprolinase (ATP-hydrolysing)
MGSGTTEKFRFCIDRGGTFTDIYAEVPGRREGYVTKLLSVDPSNYDDAPIKGIRRILEDFSGVRIPRSTKIPTGKIEWILRGIQGSLLTSLRSLDTLQEPNGPKDSDAAP